MILIGIIISIIMFSIIVIIHEYGHYKTARIFGIHVEEFGLGIPPRAKKLWKNKSGTLFSLNWIPLGGFVKIAGENELLLEYYSKKGKLLSLESLQKKLIEKDTLYDKTGGEISKVERKLIKARLKNLRPGENFYEKNIFQKSLVLLAGVFMNFLLAAVIFIVLFFIGVKPVGINSFIETDLPSKLIPTLEQSIEEGIIKKQEGIILIPMENSLAETAGIQEGDTLLAINGVTVFTIEQAQEIIQASKNTLINLSLIFKSCTGVGENENCTQKGDIKIIPDETGKIGSYLSPNYELNESFEYKYGLWDSVKYGVLETYYQIRLTLSGLGILGSNIFAPETPEDRTEALEQVAGPIGIVGVISSALAGGGKLLLVLGAIISISLGVFNLLPIPALDGGRLLLLWVRTGLEKIFGKKSLFAGIENLIHIFFFIALIAISILIAYNDIINISSR